MGPSCSRSKVSPLVVAVGPVGAASKFPASSNTPLETTTLASSTLPAVPATSLMVLKTVLSTLTPKSSPPLFQTTRAVPPPSWFTFTCTLLSDEEFWTNPDSFSPPRCKHSSSAVERIGAPSAPILPVLEIKSRFCAVTVEPLVLAISPSAMRRT